MFDFEGTISVGFEIGTNTEGTLSITEPALELPGFIDVAEPHDVAIGFISVT